MHVRDPKGSPFLMVWDLVYNPCPTPLWILLEWYKALGWHQYLGFFFLWVWSWGMNYKQAFVEWLVMFDKPVLSWIQPFGHESGKKAQVQVWQSGKQHVCGPCLAIAVKKISHLAVWRYISQGALLLWVVPLLPEKNYLSKWTVY